MDISPPVGVINLTSPECVVNLTSPVGVVNLTSPECVVNLASPVGVVNLTSPVGVVNLTPPVGAMSCDCLSCRSRFSPVNTLFVLLHNFVKLEISFP